MTQVQHRKASDIYKAQNTLIHKAFHDSGLPYTENKEVWLSLIHEVAQGSGRKVQGEINGISDLTLGERQRLINHFQKKGMKIFSPSVPVNIRDWKKGDQDIEYEFRVEDDTQVRMAYAIWAEMGYQPKTLRGLCFKMFNKDDPRWLKDEELRRLVIAVKRKAESKGCGQYYRRSEPQSVRR